MAKLYIGTSGWNYPHWKKRVYPEDVPQKEWLQWYSGHFSSVEINNSFYQLPEKKTLETWRNTFEGPFCFSIKASRYITHMKKLKEPREAVDRFLDHAKVLGEKLGPVLFQLPPRWKKNPDRLQSFFSLLPRDFRYTFEFRDETWFHDDIYQILEKEGAAFCIYHLNGIRSPKELTSDFSYIRLHGPSGAYRGSYSDRDLAGWAGAISTWMDNGKDVYCYFDNDEKGYAFHNAKRLSEMLS